MVPATAAWYDPPLCWDLWSYGQVPLYTPARSFFVLSVWQGGDTGASLIPFLTVMSARACRMAVRLRFTCGLGPSYPFALWARPLAPYATPCVVVGPRIAEKSCSFAGSGQGVRPALPRSGRCGLQGKLYLALSPLLPSCAPRHYFGISTI